MGQPEIEPAQIMDPKAAIRLSNLRLARGAIDVFPDSVDTLQPQRIREIDGQALLTLGALGVNQSYDHLDSWLRFPRAEQGKLDAELERNPQSLYAVVLGAARYTQRRKYDIMPPLDHTTDPNHARYMRFKLYRDAFAESRIKQHDQRVKDQLQLTAISIFGFALYQRTHPKQ